MGVRFFQLIRSRGGLFIRFCLLMLMLYAFAGLLCLWVARSTHRDWDGNRLARMISIFYGYALYYPADSGPVTGFIYPPVATFSFGLASLARQPTAAIIMADVTGYIFYFFPCWLLLSTARNTFYRISLLGLFIWETSRVQPLVFAASHIHVDSIMLGYCGLACVGLDRYGGGSRHWLWLSASAAIAAVGSKLIALPLLPILLLYARARYGPGVARTYLRHLIVGGFVLLILILLFSRTPTAGWFNIFQVPGHHPWTLRQPWELQDGEALVLVPSNSWSKMEALGFLAIRCFKNYGKIILAACLMAGWAFGRWRRGLYDAREGNDNRLPLSILLWGAALATIPTSLLGAIKVGGDLNNFASFLYFFVLAIVVSLPECVQWAGQKIGRPVELWFAVAASIFFIVTKSFSPVQIMDSLQSIRDNPQQRAWQFVCENPDQVYLPDNLLPTLLADRKLYHLDHGIRDREMAGHALAAEHWREALPCKLRFILVDPDDDAWDPDNFPSKLEPLPTSDWDSWRFYKVLNFRK